MSAGRAVVFRPNQAAEERLYTQRLKVISGDHFADGAFALPAIARIEVNPRASQNICEDGVFVADSLVHRIGEVFVFFLGLLIDVLDDNEFLRIADREVAEQNGIDQGEQAGVCANAERQSQNCNRCETGVFH